MSEDLGSACTLFWQLRSYLRQNRLGSRVLSLFAISHLQKGALGIPIFHRRPYGIVLRERQGEESVRKAERRK